MRKFKIGDMVKITGTDYSLRDQGCHESIKTGAIFEVMGVSTTDVRLDVPNSPYIDFEDVELVKGLSITLHSKYSIGEAIEWKYSEWHGFDGTIKDIRYNAKSAKFEYKIIGDAGFNFDEDHLRYPEVKKVIEVTMADLELKYGAKVKVIK